MPLGPAPAELTAAQPVFDGVAIALGVLIVLAIVACAWRLLRSPSPLDRHRFPEGSSCRTSADSSTAS